ncbi:glycoside hydrolase family 78 protein [Actinoallomurus sp. NBC_01490]|uniref:glycoside hydrolase family 78 protein n=1 Tax=Actinoallomurus sp. NBC_01490 TaxID=2903557 RepID=UPI002E341D23|nr:glycoside hydrolase family 78 protein [Actinoallomurus sp. NBC_01490]
MRRKPYRLLILPATLAVAAGGLAVSPASAAPDGIRVLTTTTEYAGHPLGIDAPHPRLSWRLGAADRDESQSAYEVRVASSPAKLAHPDVWDSGRVTSNQSVLVPYAGPALRSRTRYHWQVRVWDAHGRPSEWSTPSWWEMGLLGGGDWQAQWIGHNAPIPLPTSFTKQNDPSQLEAGHTQGQTFTSDQPFTSVGASAPTWVTTDSGMTLSLYKDGPGGELVARQRFDPHPDNAWATLKLDTAAPAGTYYLEESDPKGTIGWWSQSDGGYDHGQAYVDGKPTSADRTIRWQTVADKPDGLTPELRKEFTAGKKIKQARLYATALGVYRAEINGHRVGDDELAPGWTDYSKRVQYQTYDVTGLVRQGGNAIGATLAPGWYAGNVASFGPRQYGDRPYLRAQLEIDYTDGSTDRIVTDGSWKSATGPVVDSDLLMGEDYDARDETPGWSSQRFDDSAWKPVLVKNGVTAATVAQADPPVRVERELRPVKVTERSSGDYIYDLGQNMVGTVRLRASGTAGQKLTIRHAEVLNKDGSLYTDNLRTAKATDTYTLRGGDTETYEPAFTFHGFRYVEVTGATSRPDVVGRVMHTDAPFTMDFHTDVPMLNQLQSNITWGQRGNFLSVPTDTPARDERLGWTGDINVFSGTAAYNMNSASFLAKWLTDLRDDQTAEGSFTDVAPMVGSVGNGSAGWGDAGVTVPWTLYERYGDRSELARNYPAMTKWIAYLEKNSTGYLRPASGYGDWLNVNDDTPKDVIATAYFAYAAGIVAKAARALGEDASPYDALVTKIRDAFDGAYVSGDGRVKGDTQTAYVLALSMDLLPAAQRQAAADRLVELIKAKDWHLSTGFLGTPRLLPTLTATGHTDVAYRLLTQRTFPSWGYQIDKGATTMWERWDSIKPDGSFQDAAMNSFNHYAYGSVGEWMYQNIAGISPASPGFAKTVIRPRPGGGVHTASGRYDSVYGPIATRWTDQNGRFTLDVTVPVNTTAEVWVPAASAAAVTQQGARFLRLEDGCAVYAVGSGSYHFTTG